MLQIPVSGPKDKKTRNLLDLTKNVVGEKKRKDCVSAGLILWRNISKMGILVRIGAVGGDAKALINLIIEGKHPFLGLPESKLGMSLLAISVTIICVELYISSLKTQKRNAAARLAELTSQTDVDANAYISQQIAGDTRRVAEPRAPATPSSTAKAGHDKRGVAAGDGPPSPVTPMVGTRNQGLASAGSTAGSEVVSPSSTEKKPVKLSVDEFIKQLVSTGLDCRKQKVAGQPSTPASERAKCLKMKSDGQLYFHSETFKVRRIWSSDETWRVEDLNNAVEGSKAMGEIFLEFVHPHSLKSKIICILIDDARQRKMTIQQFNDLARCAATSPEWLRKTIVDIYKNTTRTSPGSSPSTPSISAGKSISSSSTPGGGGGGSSIGSYIDSSSPASSAAAAVSVNSNTNFHDWTDKELIALIKSEKLDNDIIRSRERQDLIRVLETQCRTKQGKPSVNVNFKDFQSQLVAIYTRFNPDKVPEIPKMAAHFQGQEKYLLETIISKYKVQEEDLYLFGVVLGSQKFRRGA